MASKEKSSIPVKHGVPNPVYGQALELVRNISDYRVLAARIRAVAAEMQTKSGKVSMPELLREIGELGVKEELRKLYEGHTNVPKEKPVLGPPPAVNELYGRFGRGLSIIDVGSGNCMKLVKASGVLTITAVDPNLTNDTKLVLTPVKLRLGEFLQQALPQDPIFSSFMSLPQIPYTEWEPIKKFDGLHVIPDHAVLARNGIAVLRDDGMIRVRTGVCDYVDYPMDEDGTVIEAGYMLTPFFKERVINIELEDVAVQKDYSPVIDASPAGFYDLNFQDLGPKFDGIAVELEANEGQAYIVDRAGKERLGLVAETFHFCLHLEELAECYTLIRIVSWRGIVPPHSGKTLRAFADKVRIFINAKPVLAGPQWDGGTFDRGPVLHWTIAGKHHEFRPPVDGVISREDGKDRYCKYMWTVDISAARIPKLKKLLLENGYLLEIEGAFFDGLTECTMTRNGGVVLLKPSRSRTDKTKETTDDTVLYLVDRPTLGETELITGCDAQV